MARHARRTIATARVHGWSVSINRANMNAKLCRESLLLCFYFVLFTQRYNCSYLRNYNHLFFSLNFIVFYFYNVVSSTLHTTSKSYIFPRDRSSDIGKQIFYGDSSLCKGGVQFQLEFKRMLSCSRICYTVAGLFILLFCSLSRF